MKKLLFKKIFLISVGVFFAISTKVQAGDVEPINHTGPANNQISTSDTADFSFTFKVPELNITDLNNQNRNKDTIYFEASVDGASINLNQVTIDGATATTVGNGKYLIIFNGNKIDYENKIITKKWSLKSNTSVSSKVFTWKLYDYYTKKEYVKESFTYKTNSNYSGWYFITKGEASSYYFYRVSDRYNSESACSAAKPTYLSQNPGSTITTDCKYYDTLPSTPINEDKPVDINGKTSAVENKSTYNFLAPIGKIKCMDSTGKNEECLSNNIGTYLNFIFKFGIGLSAALAVLMLILGGIMYMGEESIFGKVEAKHKMKSAIFGLLIALAAWALLYTINPELTGQDGQGNAKQLNIDSADITLERTSGGGYFGVDLAKGGTNANKNITTYDTQLKNASQKYGIECTLLKAFMYAESGGVNGLTSPSGAQGLIQLMPATFQEQNVGSNPMDPATNTMAAASYISRLKNTGCNGSSSSSVCSMSNIQYLAASYNGGPRANKQSNSCPNSTVWLCTQNSGYSETRVYAPRVEANYNKLKEKGWGC